MALLVSTNPSFTGTQVNYCLVCKRKLWLFSHDVTMEHTSDAVYLGKLLGEEAYARRRKEVMIDEHIKIDFMGTEGVIHEVKKSDKVEDAHLFQLLYYLFYLKQKGVENVRGEINYPTLKKKVPVQLTPEKEQQLLRILHDIDATVAQQQAPPRIEKRFCKKCSYFELCWG